ncbi:hypothetical protein [Shouchella lonarensis]|uniref:hypothetical protein n=1 Tax=Shouchella lonarensis TaxID=1464122 RepID=UPI0015A0DCE4|nr:hypothetical protein [Shouchella lonarensis]
MNKKCIVIAATVAGMVAGTIAVYLKNGKLCAPCARTSKQQSFTLGHPVGSYEDKK